MIERDALWPILTETLRLDDDDVDDDDDIEDEDDDEDGDDEDQEGDDDEPETWQVSEPTRFPLKGGSGLTSGIELPRLAGIFQLC
jgi:hypothetical protein